MGYCPYQCMLCGCVEDNGWGGTWQGLNWLLEEKGYKFVELNSLDEDGYGVAPDFCDDCLGKIFKNASELPEDAFD